MSFLLPLLPFPIKNGHTENTRLLLKAGAKASPPPTKTGMNPLRLAISFQNVRIVSFLLAAGANPAGAVGHICSAPAYDDQNPISIANARAMRRALLRAPVYAALSWVWPADSIVAAEGVSAGAGVVVVSAAADGDAEISSKKGGGGGRGGAFSVAGSSLTKEPPVRMTPCVRDGVATAVPDAEVGGAARAAVGATTLGGGVAEQGSDGCSAPPAAAIATKGCRLRWGWGRAIGGGGGCGRSLLFLKAMSR